MGLGAYLAGITDRRHYTVELARENRQVLQHPEQEIGIMSDLFAEYGLSDEDLRPLVKKLKSNPDNWVKVGCYHALGNIAKDGASILTYFPP
jgi:hypothetical protein